MVIRPIFERKIHLLSQAGELLLTLHAGIAQAESENKSENIKWGLRRSTMDPDVGVMGMIVMRRKDSSSTSVKPG
jgi:hypothetical protein